MIVRPEGFSSLNLSYSEIMGLDIDETLDFCAKLNERRADENAEYEKVRAKQK